MNKNMAVTVALEGIDKLNPKLKQAIGQVKELEGKTLSARDKLRTLVVLDNQFKGLDTAKAKLGEVAAALEKAKQRAQETSMFQKMGQATEGEMRAAAIAVEKLENKFSDLSDAVSKAQSKIAARGFSNIDQVRAGMPAQIAAAQKAADAQARMDAARNRASALQSRAGGLAIAGAGMTAGGYSILAPLKGATDASAAYNSALRQIAITADLTDAQMHKLGRTLMVTSAQTGKGSGELQGGIAFLIAAGMRPEVAERSIATIGKVSAAYKAEIDSIASASFVLNDALDIQPEKLQGALAIMAKAGKEGNVELRDMAAVLPTLGAGMAALKLKGPEAVATVAASLQIARKGAKTADEAANNMQNFLVKVLSPETLKKASKGFGLDLYGIITGAQKSGKNPIEAAIVAIGKATKGGDQKLLGDLFQDMQVQSFLRPMLQNMDEYQRIKAEALGAGGGQMIDQDFARVARDMDQTINRMGNAWDNLKIKAGFALAPALEPVLEMLGRAATAMVNFTERHPELTKWLVIVAGVVGVLLMAFGGLTLAIAAVMIPFATLSMAAAFMGIGLLPLTLIILGIVAAIGAVIAVFVYWDEIVANLGQRFDNLLTEIRPLTDLIFGVAEAIGTGMFAAWTKVKTLWETVSLFDMGVQLVQGLVDGVMGMAGRVVGAIGGVVLQGITAAKTALGIRSPSRVFMEIGGYTTAGLAMGLQRGAPDVISTVNRLASGVTAAGVIALSGSVAAAPVPTVTPAITANGAAFPQGAGGPGSGMQFGNVTIVIQGADKDPREIAAEVAKQLGLVAQRDKTAAQARFYED